MSKILLYEQTFNGLMCALYWSFHYMVTRAVSETCYQANLVDSPIVIATDEPLAERVIKRIKKRFGQIVFQRIFCAYLSEDELVGQKIIAFVHVLKDNPSLAEHYGHPTVHPVYALSKSVTREAHLITGLLRFKQLKSGIYYAVFTPTYDVLSIVANHFESRLGDQRWLIHDKKRMKACSYNGAYSVVHPFCAQSVDYHDTNAHIELLWARYYNDIAIVERTNDAQRRNFMPKKYWKYLTEMQQIDSRIKL